MFKEISGARGLVFLAIKHACGGHNQWTALSYQNITDAAGCGPLDYTRYALRVLLNANIIEKRKSTTCRKNEWRINPNLEAALDQLMQAHEGVTKNA